jgi:hypothetical protein
MEPRGELSLVLDDWATDGLLEVGSFGVDCCDWYGVNGDCGDCSCLAGTHDGADVRIVAGRKVLTPSTCRSRLPRCYRPAPNGPSGLLLSDLAVWDGHVAMVVGNGMMIEAGDPVQLVAAAARRSDEELDNTHLKRIAGRFARRVQGQGQPTRSPSRSSVPIG